MNVHNMSKFLKIICIGDRKLILVTPLAIKFLTLEFEHFSTLIWY